MICAKQEHMEQLCCSQVYAEACGQHAEEPQWDKDIDCNIEQCGWLGHLAGGDGGSQKDGFSTQVGL
jgi:hypothetical protein